MVKIKDFTLDSKNLGGHVPPSSYAPPAHVHRVVVLCLVYQRVEHNLFNTIHSQVRSNLVIHSQVRSNLVLVALVCAAGALLSAYLGSFFLVVAKPPYRSQQNACDIERSRADWPAFLSLGALGVYVGPHLFSFALAVALLASLQSERRRARLLRDGIYLSTM